MSAGQSNRTKLNVGRGATTDDIVREVNRLPFAYVGFNVSRPTNFTITTANAWLAFPLATKLFDSDKFISPDFTRAVVPAGCGGLYRLGFIIKALTGAINTKVKLTVNGATVQRQFVSGIPYNFDAPPIPLSEGDVVQWFVQSTSTSEGIRFEVAGDDLAQSPQVYGYRVGLLP